MLLEGIGKWKVVIAVEYIKKKTTKPDTFPSRPSKHDEAGTCHEEKKNCLVQFAFQGFQCWSLFANGKDFVGWKGPHESLSPTFHPSRLGSELRPDCSGHCLAGPQSRGSTASLGSCSSSPHSALVPTPSQSLFSCSSLPVLGAPHCSFLSSPSHGHWQAALWHTKAIVSPGWAGPFSSASPHSAISPALTVLQPFSEFVSACQHLSCVVGPKASVTQVVLDHI